MSAINNTMTLNDQVTPAFNNMIATMQRTLNLFHRLNNSMGNLTNNSNIERVGTSFSRIDGNVRAVRRSVNQTSNAIRNTTTATNNMNRSINNPSTASNVERVSRSFSRMSGNVRAVRRSVDQTSNAIRNTTTATNNTTSSSNRLRNGIQQASQQAQSLKTRLSSINFMNIYMGIKTFTQLAESISRVTEKLDDMSLTASRLNNINDGLQSVDELNNKIFDSANRMGMGYTDVAKQVAKLNLLAGDNLKTNDEAIAFVELLNKIGHISGSDSQEIAAGIYQINQAMAAGKLQGDEFRSVMETFPMFADYIAKFTGKSKGQLKEMSSEGTITADIMKKALFNAADEINGKFASLPKTFKQQMTIARNYAEKGLKPVAEKFGKFINSNEGAKFFENIAAALVTLANVGSYVFELIVKGINFISENVALLGTIVATVAGIWAMSWMLANAPLVGVIIGITALIWILSQLGLTSRDVLGLLLIGIMLVAAYFAWLGIQALIAGVKMAVAWLLALGPIGWIILGIIAIITVILLLSDTVSEVIGAVIGIFFMFAAAVLNIAIFFYNIFGELAVFFQNVFIDPVNAVIMLFYGFAESCLECVRWIVQGIEDLINMLPGVEVDFTSTIDNMIAKVRELKAEMESAGMKTFEQKSMIDFKTAFNKGNNLMKGGKKGGAGGAKNPFTGKGSGTLGGLKIPGGGAGLGPGNGKNKGKGNGKLKGGKLDKVGKIEDDVTITDEDIKMLKDIATTELLNSYTTLQPNMSVQFTGPINETADINKILEAIEDMAEDALSNVILEEGA